MKIFWYWPFARPEELGIADRDTWAGSEILVSVIDRDAAPEAHDDQALRIQRDLPDVERAVGKVAWVFSRARTYWARWWIRRRHERSGRFDIVHYHYPNRFTDLIGRPKTTWVMSIHDASPHVTRLPSAIERRLLRQLYRRPDALIVHHRWIASRLVDEFDVEPGRVHVVPHQVFPVPSGNEAPPSDSPPLVLFFGALRPNKGVPLLLDAISRCSGSPLHFHIAGHGDVEIESEVRRAAGCTAALDVEIGFVSLERKRELFRAASVVVLPYTAFESQSGVLHDAYGHGRPVVVTDVGALGETVRTDGTGVVAEPNPDALLEAIRAVLNDWDLFADACRTVAQERTPTLVAHELRRVYESIRPHVCGPGT